VEAIRSATANSEGDYWGSAAGLATEVRGSAIEAGFTDERNWNSVRVQDTRRGRNNQMQKQRFCVYNQTRESFLSLGVAAADTSLARLKGLIGKLTLGLDEGLWLVPSRGIHTLGVLFPLDLVYLDQDLKVIHVVESFPTFRISPLITQAASVLELPTHTIYSSQTQPGDQLVICVAEEMEQRLRTGTPNLTSQAK
jgi:uncharacterized membrane protein (UPF0127 family)